MDIERISDVPIEDARYLKLDQTSAQNFTAGAVSGTGILYVTSGVLGLDSSVYLTTETDPLSLHLDQTTPQTVSNGAPHFNGGIIIKAGQKIVLDGA